MTNERRKKVPIIKKDSITYKDAGVDVPMGEEVVENLKELVKSTWSDKIVPTVSGFQAVYDLGTHYLIGATDGVGTKLLVGIMADDVGTVGQDLVAMCVNDLARVGSKPLFFLDYLATGRLNEKTHYEILEGIVEGCMKGGFPLLGGETAELPGMYKEGHFDLAGFAVGIVEKNKIIDGKDIKPDDIILGIESSGLHSNGYSLARKVIFDKLGLGISEYKHELGERVRDALLRPTIIYTKPILDLLENYPSQIKGMAHITGGGIPNKLPKALPLGLGAEIQIRSWPVHPIFDYIAKNGPVEDEEMRKTFNMGIGMVAVVNDSGVVPDLTAILNERHNLKSYVIGKVVKGNGVYYIK